MKSICLLASLTAMFLANAACGATISPVADTWLQNGSVANNSADTSLRVKNQNNQLNDRVTFIRFDGAAITGPVSSASLRVAVSAFSSPTNMTLQLFGVPDGAANENFDATTLTFANSGYTDQSADNNVNDALFQGGAPLATAALLATDPVGTVLTFSSADLVNFLNANTGANLPVAFVLTTSTIADSVFFSVGSVDNATAALRPALNFEPVPEPASWALAGLASLAALIRRRR